MGRITVNFVLTVQKEKWPQNDQALNEARNAVEDSSYPDPKGVVIVGIGP